MRLLKVVAVKFSFVNMKILRLNIFNFPEVMYLDKQPGVYDKDDIPVLKEVYKKINEMLKNHGFDLNKPIEQYKGINNLNYIMIQEADK